MKTMPVPNKTALLFALYALVCTGLVAITYQATATRIIDNEKQRLLNQLFSLVPADQIDNDPSEDLITLTNTSELGTSEPVTVYRARRAGKNFAAIFATQSHQGYNGRIRLLVAIDQHGKLIGIKTVSHKETPGLGDKIESNRSDWAEQFVNKSLVDPQPQFWKVKKDGGQFDQLTGATITPRAIVKTVLLTLRYFDSHQSELFAGETQHES